MNWGCSLKEKLTKLNLYFYFSGMVLLRKEVSSQCFWWVKVRCVGEKKYKGKKCLNNWLQEIYRLANTADWTLLIGKETEKGLTYSAPHVVHILLALVKGNQIIAHEHILSVEGAENLQQTEVELYQKIKYEDCNYKYTVSI